MQIIHHLQIDLARRMPVPPLGAVQNDANTRCVAIDLLENGSPWAVPAGVTGAVAFRKPDGHQGLYDQLPDGTKAVTIDGSTVTAILAPQVLSCAGEVSAAVVFHDPKLNQLASFPFAIRAERNPAAGQPVSNDYYSYTTMEAVSEAVDAALASLEEAKQDILAKAEEALRVVHDTATEDAPAIVCEASGTAVTIADASDRPLRGLTLFGKTTQNGTPTPDAPVALESVGESIAVTVAGKNLLDLTAFTNSHNQFVTSEISENGITMEVTALSNNFQQWSGYLEGSALTPLIGKTVTFSCGEWSNTDSAARPCFAVTQYSASANNGTQTRYMKSGNSVTFTVKEDTTRLAFLFRVDQNIASAIGTVAHFGKLQLEIGDTVTAYEPYKPIQTLTVSTPNGLCGIPVSSGGNHTDENGQQWICDEIDFARGVRVQRFHEVEPIETPLSAQELAQFAALHGNKPNTIIFNDSDADMFVEYVADTKLYIDQKLAAISAALLQ